LDNNYYVLALYIANEPLMLIHAMNSMGAWTITSRWRRWKSIRGVRRGSAL